MYFSSLQYIINFSVRLFGLIRRSFLFILLLLVPITLIVFRLNKKNSVLRGRGIGRKVVCDVIDYARSKDYKRVTIDADFRNHGAKRLYEKIGFRVFNKKSVKIRNFERGMYNMELLLKQ